MSDTFAMGPKTDLTGKVAVITGAARDLGLALALYAADRGMKVALADQNECLLAAALEQVRAKDVDAIAVPGDVLNFTALCELARRGVAERDGGHIVNIVATEVFGTRGAAPDAAITHAIMGLSESLYRELDLRGSRVGVTLVCPALSNTNIASAPEHQNSSPHSTRYVPLNSFPPEDIAAQIFCRYRRAELLVLSPHVSPARGVRT